MANLPEYKEHVAVQPGGITESSSAFKSLSNAWGMAGTIATSIAQSSADERAKIAGLEAGNTPGRDLFPGITQTTRAFDEAYSAQEYAVVVGKAESQLNRLTFEARKNPNASSLSEFESAANGYIRNTLSSVTPETKARLTPLLTGTYEASKLQIETDILKESRKSEQNNNLLMLDQTIKSINDMSVEGQARQAEELAAQQLEYLNSDYVKSTFKPKEIEEWRQNILDTLRDSKWQREAQQLSQQPGALENRLREMAEESPTIDNLAKQKIFNDALKRRNTLRSASDNVSVNQALTKMADGTLTPKDVYELKNTVDVETFSQFETKYATYLAKKNNKTDVNNHIRERAKDTAFLSTLTPKQKNDFLIEETQNRVLYAQSQGIPVEDTMTELAKTARDYSMSAPMLIDMLEQTARYGTPEELSQAGRVINLLQGDNPIAIQSLDKEAKAVANLYSKYRNISNAPNAAEINREAAEKARKDVYNLSDDIKAERMNALDRFMSKNHYITDQTKFKKKIADEMGFNHTFNPFKSSYDVPEGLTNTFYTLLPDYALIYDSPDEAIKALAKDLKPRYNETNINDPSSRASQVMKDAPDTLLKNFAVGEWVYNDKARAFHDYVEQYNKSGTNIYGKLEWLEDPFKDKDIKDVDMFSKRLVEGKIKAIYNGDQIEVLIDSDELTRGGAGGLYSWNFQYKVEGSKTKLPFIQSVDNRVIPRWYPDLNLREYNIAKFNREQQIQLQQQAEIQQELAKLPENNPQLVRDKYLADQQRRGETLYYESDYAWIKELTKEENDESAS